MTLVYRLMFASRSFSVRSPPVTLTALHAHTLMQIQSYAFIYIELHVWSLAPLTLLGLIHCRSIRSV